MRPTENFLLFLPCGKGVEGGSGQFFSVLFCKTALAICILLPAPLSQKISRKSLARSRPLHPFRTAYPPSICNHKDILFGAFAKTHCQCATVEGVLFCFLAPRYDFSGCRLLLFYAGPSGKKRNRKTEHSSVLQMLGCFVSRKPRRPTGAHFFLSESWSFSLTSSSISVRRVLMSLNWRCTEA